MKAWVFGGMLVLSASLAACSSSSTDGAGGGGDGGGAGEGGGDGGGSNSPTVGTGSTGTSSPTSTGTSSPTSTGTGNPTCSVPGFFNEPTCDSCLVASCCTEMEQCIADFEGGGEDCVLQDGSNQFSDGPLADAFFTCLENNCAEDCGGGGICGTGVGFVDQNQQPIEELNECLDANCCEPFLDCFGDFTDQAQVDACDACLQNPEGGPECNDLIACDQANGCGLVPVPICESGLSVNDAELAECLSGCCDEFTECTGDQSDAAIDACLTCLQSEAGGELCNAAIACAEAEGCF